MSQMFLKILLGSNSSGGQRIVPVPEGTEVLFTNEPPTAQFIDSNDKVIRTFNLTHSAYLINGEGKTISSFNNNNNWNVITHDSKLTKTANTSYENWVEELHTLTLAYKSDFIFTDVTAAVDKSHYDRHNDVLRGGVAGLMIESHNLPISHANHSTGIGPLYNYVQKYNRAIHFVSAKCSDQPGFVCCLVKKGSKLVVQFFNLIEPINKSPAIVSDNSVKYIRKITDVEWNETTFNLFTYSGVIETTGAPSREITQTFFDYFYDHSHGSNAMPAIFSYIGKYYLAVESHTPSPKVYEIINLDENHRFISSKQKDVHPLHPEN